MMIISGTLKVSKTESNVARYFVAPALVAYMSMVWKRFDYQFCPDWAGFNFDAGIVIFMLIVISRKPNKAIQYGR